MKDTALNNPIQTERLILRPWKDEDLEPLAKLNVDPRVTAYFPGLKTREESDASVKFMSNHFERCGWGFWAVSLIQTSEFIGFIGLREIYFKTDFTPAVEIGWRLAFNYWGKGYATEGALASLRYGFEKLKLEKIVSYTAAQHMKSRAVMERIGMHHHPKDDFDHPRLPENYPFRRQVLYQLTANQWQEQAKKSNTRPY
jgi:3-dehydroquinate dehydratase/shikimate dehydrogenase